MAAIALEALPEISLLAAGTLLFLLAGAMLLVIELVKHLSAHVSFLGWHPLDAVAQWLEDARNRIIYAYRWDFSHLAALFEWTVHSGWSFAKALVITLDEIEQKAAHAAGAGVGEVLHVTEKEIAHAAHAIVLPIEHGLEKGIGNARRYADGLVTTAEREIDRAWREAVGTVSREIAGVKDRLGSIEKELAKIGTIAGVASIAGLAVKVAEIAKEVEQCAVTTCNGPNNIGKVLKDLYGAATIGSEVGFLAEAIKDPAGTEKAIAGMIEKAWHAGHSLLDDLLSL
jgi:hypothetical protein